VDLFFAPWNDKDALKKISNRNQRQVLFESGEGLNVYEEAVANNQIFFDTFNAWAKVNLDKKPVKLNIKTDCWQDTIFEFVKLCKSQRGPFSELRTPLGYLMLTRILNFLHLIEAFPNVLYEKSGGHTEYVDMISDLKNHAYLLK